MKTDYPLITCICITYNRISLLKKAVSYFIAQDYPNKELLVSYPQKDKLTEHVVDKLIAENSTTIRSLKRPDQMKLGDARNLAIAESNGEYICTWDDDDWYHPSRLSYQMYYLYTVGKELNACVLKQIILYDKTTEKAYASFYYPWENTLLCKKDVLNEFPYISKDQGEDSGIIDFLEGSQQLYHLPEVPFLYIYIYHSNNTWGYAHFKSFINRSELLNQEWTNSIIQLIE